MLIDKDKIAEAKKKLGDDNFLNIMNALGINEYDEKNKKCICIFHVESTPSFIYNPKQYNMHCFGCGKQIDLIDAFMRDGFTYLESVQKLFELAGVKHSFGEFKVKTKAQYKYPKEVTSTSKEKVYAYLQTRGISSETSDYADIREDEHGNLVFNYYDTNDVLSMVKYRPPRKIEKGEAKMWCQPGADTTPLLFNMNRINTNNPLLITEGELDALAVIEAGYQNVVSVPLGAGNFHWIEENWDWLEEFESIIVASDNDESGLKMQKEVIFRLGNWRTKVVEIPQYFDKPDGTKVNVKDLNEVLYLFGKEKLLEIILNAKDSPVDSVVDFSDIEDINLEDIDGIKIGTKSVDRELMKLFYGTFNVLTGINGAGKTSLLSQIVCQSLEQDKKVWFYSGELPNHQTKNWISFILTGQRHLQQYEDEDSAIYWRASKETKKKLNDFYRDKLYIYKDGHTRKVSSILKSMEDSVRKYGVKLLIIDNLTALNLESNDSNKYEKQAEFVTELIDFAKKYNIVLVLVVHPHKMDMTRRMNKMDLQGVMALSDLAHRVISLYRVSEDDKKGIPKKVGQGWQKEPIKYDVLFDILKDRMRGSEGKSIGLYYDRPSRRFFTNISDLDYRYKWDVENYNTPLPYPPKQLIDNTDEVFGKVNNG